MARYEYQGFKIENYDKKGKKEQVKLSSHPELGISLSAVMNVLFNIATIIFGLGITLYTAVITLANMLRGNLDTEKLDQRFRWWASSLLKFTQVTYTVYGRDVIRFAKNKKYIVMCNHASHFDIPLAVMALNTSVRMLVKKELIQVPIWGKAMLISDMVSIDRKNFKRALKDLERAKAVLEKGIVLWIAPEGTRSKTGKLQPFKSGGFKLALDTDATIIPMGIRGSHHLMPARTLKIKRGKQIDIHFGTPIDASNYQNRHRKELITAVQDQIRELCGQ